MHAPPPAQDTTPTTRDPARRARVPRPQVVLAIAIAVALLTIGAAPAVARVAESAVSLRGGRNAGSRPVNGLPTPDGHRRLLLVGDSLTYGGAAQFDAEMTSHGVTTRYVGGPGTGLLSNQDRWILQTAQQIEAFHPDVVVIEACCNYALFDPRYVTASGVAVAPDSPLMYAEWAKAARSILTVARSGGATVHWVTTPDAGPLLAPKIEPRIRRFNAISAALPVSQIDWRAVVEPHGAFTSTVDGVRVRQADDLHLTAAGSERVAVATWNAISHDPWR